MEALGIMLFVVIVWAWWDPKGVGKWLADVRNAYDIHWRRTNQNHDEKLHTFRWFSQ